MMHMGSIEYDPKAKEIRVRVGGNLWRKPAKGLEEAGFNLNSSEEVAKFTKAAAPGGDGIEDLGYERVRAELMGDEMPMPGGERMGGM